MEYGAGKLIEAFLFLIVSGAIMFAYLTFLFKREARKVAFLSPSTDSCWMRGNTTPLMLDKRILRKEYIGCNGTDEGLLDPELYRVVYFGCGAGRA